MQTKVRVLVVDDDSATLQTLTQLLRHFGFDVTSEKTPDEAVKLLERQDKFAVLVCDFEMPAMNGEQLARRAKELRPNLPVFVFSGTNPPEIDQTPWDGWFLKGIAISELIVRLQACKPVAGHDGADEKVRECAWNSEDTVDTPRSLC